MKLKISFLSVTVLYGALPGCASIPDPAPQPQQQTVTAPTNKSGTDDLRDLIAEVRNEIDESESIDQQSQAAAQTTKPQIPLVVNERVEFWIDYFTVRDRERFQRFLNRGENYREMIQAILKENGVPKELYYLAMIESGFTVHARSHANAVGVWQFIRPTGRRYGMQIDGYVDERCDPVRATIAAAKYLQDLHNVFQSWYLAMSAYNAGESRIMNAIMKANSRDFWVLAEQRALPRETMNYVPKFIAAAIIGHHPERFGFRIATQEKYPELVAKTVPSRVKLDDIARTTGIKPAKLSDINPHIRKGIIPPRKANYEIWVRKTDEHRFDDKRLKIASLKRHKWPKLTPNKGGNYHRVRRGESLARIAKKYGLSVAQIKKMNELRSNRIYSGSRLLVRVSKPTEVTASDIQGGVYRFHIVQRGDTLFKISKKYNVTMSYLKRLNSLRRSTVYAGQRLKVSKHKRTQSYRVRRGDSLTKIATKFGISVGAIKRINRLRRNTIYAGQVLKLAL